MKNTRLQPEGWVIPKGWPMENRKSHQVAEQEAFEEVGVKGKAEKAALKNILALGILAIHPPRK